MASDLPDLLEDLAARTPPVAPPGDLWDRGVRRRRTTRAATAVTVAAVMLLVGLGGWVFRAGEQRVEPAGTHGAPHLPDRFFQPSPWLHSFDGPPGQLVAIGTAAHHSLFHTRTGVYGVTAADGRYGFLDLPDLAGGTALSPDGKEIGYWITGRASGSPNTSSGPVVVGVGVYDTATGAVSRHLVPTVHGLMPNELTWTSDSRLLFDYSRWRGGEGDSARLNSEAADEAAGFWDGAADTFRPVRPRPGVSLSSVASTPGAPLVVHGQTNAQYWSIDLARPRASWSFQWGDVGATDHSIALNRARDRFAAVSGGPFGEEKQPNTIVAGDFRGGPGSPHRELTFPVVRHSAHTFEVLAWLDRSHVALLRQDPLVQAAITFRIDRLDVRTGAASTLVREIPESAMNIQVATDLLGAPSAHASPPPRPWNPRWVLGLSVFGLLCVGLFGWGIRGRRA